MSRIRGTITAHRPILTATAALVLAGAVGAVFWIGLESPSGPDRASSARPAIGGSPAQPAPSLLSAPYDAPSRFGDVPAQPPSDRFAPLPMQGRLGKLDDRIIQAAPEPSVRASQTLALAPPYDVLGAHSFGAAKWTVTLADVDGPEREAVCYDKDQRLFACGLAARAALSVVISRRPVTCLALKVLGGDSLLAHCRTDDGDLAVLLTRQGWLRPVTRERADLAEATAAAEAAQVGMWNGGWRIRTSERSAPPPTPP